MRYRTRSTGPARNAAVEPAGTVLTISRLGEVAEVITSAVAAVS